MATDPHAHGHSAHGDDGVTLNHETTDISLDGIGKLTVGFVLILFVVSAVMYGTYRMLDRQARAADTSISKINADRGVADADGVPLMEAGNTAGMRGRAAAGPAILTDEPAWLRGIRAQTREAQTTYGWVNKEGGVVRLPIERAKQLIVERGLPVTAPPPAVEAPADAAPDATTPAPAGVQ